jgi:phosphomannomutase
LFPDAFLDRAGKASTQYVAAIAACGTGADDYPKVMAAIEALVITLNEINDDFDGAVIETGEREEFCEFIDQVVLAHGIDIGALAAANDCDPAELTDQWRDW